MYWLTVVVVSVTGTLYAGVLTDGQGVPPRAEVPSVFAGREAAVATPERAVVSHAVIDQAISVIVAEGRVSTAEARRGEHLAVLDIAPAPARPKGRSRV
ncbi:hypothetical protein ACFY2Z_05035 [Streptomyces sp. NPDC001222]|uniref:hypothetical protein n=1 Tax=Streptomyces sp. NPDC001222 TaxID=3364548 RepID=UPI003680CD70